MTLKAGFKQCRTDTCLLYKVNELRTIVVILYVDDTLEMGYKTSLMNKIECINKGYVNQPIGELEEFVGFLIKCDLANMTLRISKPDIITKMTQVFNKYMKSLMIFNTPAKPHKGIVRNRKTNTKYNTICIRDTEVA